MERELTSLPGAQVGLVNIQFHNIKKAPKLGAFLFLRIAFNY